MANHQHGKQHNARHLAAPSPNWTPAGEVPLPATARPLSDIHEITEPTLKDLLNQRGIDRPSVSRQSSMKRSGSVRRKNSVKIVEPHSRAAPLRMQKENNDRIESSGTSVGDTRDCSSIYSIPPSSVPRRASSRGRQQPSESDIDTERSSPRAHATIPDRGQSDSPLKQVRNKFDPVTSDSTRCIPTTTFVRSPCPVDILEHSVCRHSRVATHLQVIAPVFAGGGSVEGHVRITVDNADRSRQRKSISISRIAVDLLGVEELATAHRKSVFLSLATELIDADNPPPVQMVETAKTHSSLDAQWSLVPSCTTLPFRISLPLDTGPPPFRSKHARIRYLLCATLSIRDAGKRFCIRCSQDITVLSTYDPEKALRSLPSPLMAYDEYITSKAGTVETLKITAGLHRQVWVSGTSIFVDIHVANNSRSVIRKLELSVERDILCYQHAAASTLEQSAGQARMFQDKDQTILSKSALKRGTDWNGVEPHSTLIRTCQVDVPRGHATIKCGNYFEVRFFLNIIVGTSHRKLASVQLPIILIHMNSLDVVPNAVTQVAAAIEEKRSRHQRAQSKKRLGKSMQEHQHYHNKSTSSSTPPPRVGQSRRRQATQLQGRAFAAPRQQSLDRLHAEAADIHDLGRALDRSPRKILRSARATAEGTCSPSTGKSRVDRTQGSCRHPSRKASNHARNDNGLSPGKVHKAPSSSSLGGVGVGLYTTLNGGVKDHSTAFSGARQQIRHVKSTSTESLQKTRSETQGVKDRLCNLRSFDNLRHRTKHSPPSSQPAMQQPKLGPQSLGPHSLGLHPMSLQNPGQTVGLGLGSHVHGQRIDVTSAESPITSGDTEDLRPFGTEVHSSNMVRKGSLKLRDQVDRSRFEFKAVGAAPIGTGGGAAGNGIRRKTSAGALKGWLGDRTAWARGRERSRSRGRGGDRAGFGERTKGRGKEKEREIAGWI